MVNKLLKVEQTGKVILRIGIAIYMWSVVLFSYQFDQSKLLMILVMAAIVIIPILSLMHFKNPKLGLAGGIGKAIFFLASIAILIYSDLKANAIWQLIYLHTIKDLLLAIACIVLIGESLKEMVRDRITRPFPK